MKKKVRKILIGVTCAAFTLFSIGSILSVFNFALSLFSNKDNGIQDTKPELGRKYNKIDTTKTNGEIWFNNSLKISYINTLYIEITPKIIDNISYINIVEPKYNILNDYNDSFYSKINEIYLYVDTDVDDINLYWNISENSFSMFKNLKRIYIENESSKVYNIEPGIPKSVRNIDLDRMEYLPYNKNHYNSLEKTISFNGYRNLREFNAVIPLNENRSFLKKIGESEYYNEKTGTTYKYNQLNYLFDSIEIPDSFFKNTNLTYIPFYFIVPSLNSFVGTKFEELEKQFSFNDDSTLTKIREVNGKKYLFIIEDYYIFSFLCYLVGEILSDQIIIDIAENLYNLSYLLISILDPEINK